MSAVRRQSRGATNTLLASATILTLGLAGCGSGGDVAEDDGSATPADPQTGAEASEDLGAGPSADATAGEGDTTAGDASATVGASPDSGEAAGSGSAGTPDTDAAVIRVTYESTDPATGEVTTFTWVQDPPRYRIETDGSVLVSDGTRGVTCSTPADCTELPQASLEAFTSSGLGFLGIGDEILDTVEQLPPEAVTDSGTREIAGRRTDCRTVSSDAVPGAEPGDSFEFCVDQETGWLLAASGTDLQVVAVEATDPRPDDFVIP